MINLEKSKRDSWIWSWIIRNFGVAKATGEYLAFLDDDDIWLKDKLKIQISEMVENFCFHQLKGFMVREGI